MGSHRPAELEVVPGTASTDLTTVLCCIVLCGYVTELKVCGNPVRNRVPAPFSQ